MKRILSSDWLPKRARWVHLARSGFPTLVPREKVIFFAIINPFLPKLDRSRWLEVYWPRPLIFCVFIDLDFFSAINMPKKKLGLYSVILASCLVNNVPYALTLSKRFYTKLEVSYQ